MAAASVESARSAAAPSAQWADAASARTPAVRPPGDVATPRERPSLRSQAAHGGRPGRRRCTSVRRVACAIWASNSARTASASVAGWARAAAAPTAMSRWPSAIWLLTRGGDATGVNQRGEEAAPGLLARAKPVSPQAGSGCPFWSSGRLGRGFGFIAFRAMVPARGVGQETPQSHPSHHGPWVAARVRPQPATAKPRLVTVALSSAQAGPLCHKAGLGG